MDANRSPSDSPAGGGARRVAGPRVLVIGILFVVLVTAFVVVRIVQTSGPGPDPSTIPQRPGRGSAADGAGPDTMAWVVPMGQQTVLADSSLAFLLLEGERQVLGPGLAGWRISDDPRGWLAEVTWFYLNEIPVRLRTFEEMRQLANRGAITDTTEVGVVSYRWRLAAANLDEARQVAERQVPATPPAAVGDAVRPRPAPQPAVPSSDTVFAEPPGSPR